MKKSLDYFKTLNELSRINDKVFSLVASGREYKNYSVTFYGQRYELLQRLADDFVAPVERNEIYNLTHALYEQFCKIIILGDISDLGFSLSEEHMGCFRSLFSLQADLVLLLSKKSEYKSALGLCRQGQQQLLSLKRSIVGLMLNGLQGSAKSLYRCVMLNSLVDFCRSISGVLSLCERVIIDNI